MPGKSLRQSKSAGTEPTQKKTPGGRSNPGHACRQGGPDTTTTLHALVVGSDAGN
ncbi:MAG: hypothetical protein ABSD08_15680 [Xanthobacteraceae bacterium]|jgi:hypothetical protein